MGVPNLYGEGGSPPPRRVSVTPAPPPSPPPRLCRASPAPGTATTRKTSVTTRRKKRPKTAPTSAAPPAPSGPPSPGTETPPLPPHPSILNPPPSGTKGLFCGAGDTAVGGGGEGGMKGIVQTPLCPPSPPPQIHPAPQNAILGGGGKCGSAPRREDLGPPLNSLCSAWARPHSEGLWGSSATSSSPPPAAHFGGGGGGPPQHSVPPHADPSLWFWGLGGVPNYAVPPPPPALGQGENKGASPPLPGPVGKGGGFGVPHVGGGFGVPPFWGGFWGAPICGAVLGLT